MNDMNDRTMDPTNETVPQIDATEPAIDTNEQAPAPEANGNVPHETVKGAWRTAAGRKGANRVHQLIEAGKRYEEEHGLKSGRQRLRQLIELGKLYEDEHGTRPAVKERQRRRLSKMERDEVIATLLRCLTRMVKPSFRPELERLASVLSGENGQAA